MPEALSSARGPRVDADLHITMVSPAGQVSACRLVGHDQELQLQLHRPEIVGGLHRRQLGQLAQLLAELGLTARVSGPAGPLASLGAGVSSRLGALLTGSPRVSFVVGRGLRTVTWSLTVSALQARSNRVRTGRVRR